MKLIWVATFTVCAAFAAEKKVKLEDLPAAVQAAVKEQTQNATLVGLSTEKEKGQTVYEVETKVNGKSRDLLLDQAGAVVETEEEVGIETVPAPAKAALQKRATGGTISKVEKVTAGNTCQLRSNDQDEIRQDRRVRRHCGREAEERLI